MKRIILSTLICLVSLLVLVQPVGANGDKVRGEKADGPANQNGECPFIG